MAYKVTFSGTTIDQVTALIQQSLSLGLTNAQIQAMDLDFGRDDIEDIDITDITDDAGNGEEAKFSHEHYFRDLNYFVAIGPNSPEDHFYRQIKGFDYSYLGKADSPAPAIELLDALDLKVVIKRLLQDQADINAGWAARYLIKRLVGYPSHQRQVACGIIEMLPQAAATLAAETVKANNTVPKIYQKLKPWFEASKYLDRLLDRLGELSDCFSNDMIAEIRHWLPPSHLDYISVRPEFFYRESHATDCVELAGSTSQA